MSRLHELDIIACAIQRSEYAIDAVARVAEHAAHVLCVKAGNNEIANGLFHRMALHSLDT